MMTRPNEYEAVNSAALAHFDGVMAMLELSGGKNAGREYLPINPKRDDHTPGSLSINRDKGVWADFSSGDKGGDLISLVAYIHGCKQAEAAQRLAQHLGIALQGRPKTASDGKTGAGKVPISPASQKPASASLQAPKQGDAVCVMPVPVDAPPTPKAHPKHGKPSARWAYVDVAGVVMFHHCRFEPKAKGERKQFSPLSLWKMPDGRLAWKWKSPPAPLPLLRLDRLAASLSAPVVLVEGEKARDAAAMLLPDAVIMTWAGGCNAVDKADFKPLAGRIIWLWPDADEPGRKAMRKAAKHLQAIGAAEVRQMNLNALAKSASVADGKPVLADSEALNPGDDAADLVARGWTAEHVALLLASGEFLTAGGDPPDEAPDTEGKGTKENRRGAAASSSFRLNPDGKPCGIYYSKTGWDNDESAPRWVCAPLFIDAKVRDPHNLGWGLLVSFDDSDGKLHKVTIPARAFNGEGLEASGLLLDHGLTIAPRGRPLLLEYLQTKNPKKRARITNKTGWHETEDGQVFVLPDRAIVRGGEFGKDDRRGEEWIFEGEALPEDTFSQKGTLAGWKAEISRRCKGNSRLLFSVSMAFASPLLYLIGAESGGFIWRGHSGFGKTTAMYVSASVCGSPRFMHRCRGTDNGLEALALQRCDAPLLLDELAELDPKVAGQTIYMLANGQTKTRQTKNGSLRAAGNWRCLFFLSGELGLAQHIAAIGQTARAGQETRLAEIPADAGADLGLFENIHDSANSKEFAELIKLKASQYYGTAWIAFLTRLSVEDDNEVTKTVRAGIASFNKRFLTDKASGQAGRVANRFALVECAGELATDWQITGWNAGDAINAAGECFKAWLANRGGEGKQEDQAMLDKVREYLRMHGLAKFSDTDRSNITDNHAPVTMNRAGWREKSETTDDTEYFISSEAFHADVCKGFDHAAVGRLLIAKGYAEAGTEKDRPWLIRKPITHEGRPRVVHILPALFGAEND